MPRRVGSSLPGGVLIALLLFITASLGLVVRAQGHPNAAAQDDSQLVYSTDRSDAWNRIFHHLFTRTVSHRLTADFSEGAPFASVPIIGFPDGLQISTRVFERVEIGDRAIEPFYPSFITSAGLLEALSDRHFSRLKQALIDAVNDKGARAPLQRALMQSDLWAAYDLLAHVTQAARWHTRESTERASQLLPLLVRLIKKLALTQQEIANLPDNYSLAADAHQLPDLFSSQSEWIEVRWFAHRAHDHASDFRRAARVFVKPNLPILDKPSFLERLRDNHGDVAELGAVALVTQNLLIESGGRVAATPLTYEVQTRTFKRAADGRIVETEPRQYELSRRLLLTTPRTGGFVSSGDASPMYLPAAGNDYGFATPQSGGPEEGPPVLATLRTRCVTCHGSPNASVIFTFTAHAVDPIPPVQLLQQPNDVHARYVASQKMNQGDFKLLKAEW